MSSQQLDAEFVSRLRTAAAAQLPAYLPKQRWFRSKARRIQSVRLWDAIPVPLSHTSAFAALGGVEFNDGPDEIYVLPLVGAAPDRVPAPESVVMRLVVSDSGSEQPLVDALGEGEFLVA